MIRFASDAAAPAHTKITDVKTGAAIRGVTKVQITLEYGKPPRADLTIEFIRVGLETDDVRYIAYNPASGRLEPLAALVFRDGTQLDYLPDGSQVVRPAS